MCQETWWTGYPGFLFLEAMDEFQFVFLCTWAILSLYVPLVKFLLSVVEGDEGGADL